MVISMKILIVGATSGIGYSLVKFLAGKTSPNIFIGVHYKEQITPLKEKLIHDGIVAEVVKLDVCESRDRLKINSINPDCLIVHDGVGNGGSILEEDINVLRDNYETNIFGNFSLIQQFYNIKKKNKEKGKIFVTSSLASIIPIPFLGCYTSSKAAISMLCKTLRQELLYLNKNITITLIEPGAYLTGFNQVMIDNKDKFTNFDSKIYRNRKFINRIQRNIFFLVEKKDYTDLVKKVGKEIYKEKPKFRIRRPIIQSVFIKIYLILFG